MADFRIKDKKSGNTITMQEFAKLQRGSDPYLDGSDEQIANSFLADFPDAFEKIEDKSLSGFGKNLVSSVGSDIAGSVTGALPGIYTLSRAMTRTNYDPEGNKLGPDLGEIGDSLKSDYGDFYTSGNFLDNAYNNPARVISDASMLASGFSGIAKIASLASKSSRLGQVARAARLTSDFTDPLTLPYMATGQALAHTIGRTKIPERLYAAGLQPRPMQEEALDRLLTTGVRQDILPTKSGYGKAKEKIKAIEDVRGSEVAKLQTDPIIDVQRASAAPTALKSKYGPGTVLGPKQIKEVEDVIQDFSTAGRLEGGKFNLIEGRSGVPMAQGYATYPNSDRIIRSMTPQEAHQVIKADNKNLEAHYEGQRKLQQPMYTQAQEVATKAIDNDLRTQLDDLIGDIEVSLPGEKGKKTRFKKLGLQDRDLRELRAEIGKLIGKEEVSPLFDTTGYKSGATNIASGHGGIGDWLIFAKKTIANNPQIQSRLANWIARKSPKPITQTKPIPLSANIGRRTDEAERKRSRLSVEEGKLIGVDPTVYIDPEDPYR